MNNKAEIKLKLHELLKLKREEVEADVVQNTTKSYLDKEKHAKTQWEFCSALIQFEKLLDGTGF